MYLEWVITLFGVDKKWFKAKGAFFNYVGNSRWVGSLKMSIFFYQLLYGTKFNVGG